ncbi:NfeD family protein [Nocardioides sp. L-11A]|uniref:NfeD family protein n=1 Tax=Nocardioides sp. L-11A TaxID=3043848 RepID=UPI00249BF31B|nr:NfeD family protein [Nocardioides sp. L-11A]
MTVFLVLGIAGLLLLAVSLVAGDLLDGVLDALEADWISSAVIGGFVSAFGFGGAASDGAGLPLPVSLAIGAGSGLVVGWFAWWLTRMLKDSPSDGTVSITDSVGRVATVVTDIPGEGYGVVRVLVGGHTLRLNATAHQPIEAGTEVNVTGVLSPTAVSVTEIWQP